MTRDDIIRMALEAGGCTPEWDDFWEFHQDALERFAALVAAEKEKQIINILERLQQHRDFHNYYTYAINVIRQEYPR
jgi:hypothetical protein